MTAEELFRRAQARGVYLRSCTEKILADWLAELVGSGLLEQDGARFYLTGEGREIAACLAGGLTRKRELARAA